MEQVRAALKQAEWVSLKADAVSQTAWRRVDRPHGSLDLCQIQEGMRAFAAEFEGQLVTETMLIKGVNDSDEDLLRLADFLSELQPSAAYLAIPTRPPAEAWVQPAEEQRINQAYQLLHGRVERVELLLGYEGNEFALTGDARVDLLSISAVHPMREDAVQAFLTRAGKSWDLIDELLEQEMLVMTLYAGNRFYLRKIAAAKAVNH
jgi:wyosine [tRNA(Phe)-imidazoG37] synthetase (radical SAM superfamily)